MFLNAFSGKTVLVTGHTGFKGTWLSLWLLKLGATVVGYSLPASGITNNFNACNLSQKLTHFEGDIRDIAALRSIITQFSPDFIFHLAAQPLVREAYIDPRETFDVNIMGTVALLEAIRIQEHACSLVVVSTDKCYENSEWEYGYRESDPLGGHDPYSASKAAMEVMLASYRKSFFSTSNVENGIRIASARAGNVIGGGDWAKNRIVPDAIAYLNCGMSIAVRNPNSIRPWQHVLEPISGYLWLATQLSNDQGASFATSWNFGPYSSDAKTVRELLEGLIATWGYGTWHKTTEGNAPHEAKTLKLCIDKAYDKLKWCPTWDFQTAVERTSNWYLQYTTCSHLPSSVTELCLSDISSYERDAATKELEWTS